MPVDTLTLAIETRGVKKGAAEFDSAGRKIDASGKRIDRSVLRNEASMKRMGRSSSSAAALMGRVFTGVAITAAARGSIRTFATYEQSIATVRGVLGGQMKDQDALAASMDGLQSKARELGATTRFTAADAADGILFLTRAGFDANESIAAIGPTLALAQAGMLGLGEAADFASNIVSGFGLQASDTERVVDTLVATSNRSNTDVRQLADAMKFTAPIAGALGRSVEETSAAIGVLGDAGIQGGMAGTNLRGIFVKLLNPSGEARKAISALGLSMADLDPKTNSLADIFDKLRNAGAGATEMAKIFMARNASAALVISNNTDKLRELEQANIDSAGEAQTLADVMDDTLTGAFKSMVSAAQELVLQFGEGDGGFGGVLRTVVDTMTGALRILAGMEEAVTKNRKAAFLLAGALKGVGILVATIMGFKLLGMMSAMITMLVGLPATIGAVTASIAPLLASVLAVFAAVAAFELGRYFFDEFKVVQTSMASLIKFADQTWTNVKLGWNLLLADMIDLFTTEFGQKIISIMGDIAVGVGSVFDLILPGFSKGMRGAVTGLEAVFGSGVDLTSGMRGEAIAANATDLKFAEDVYQATLKEIEASFGGDNRRGNSIAEFIKGDLQTAKAEVARLINDLAAMAENAFSNPTADDPGLMGPFKPDEIDETKKALMDALLAVEALDNAADAHATTTEVLTDKYGEWVTELEEARTALEIEMLLLRGATDEERVRNQAKARGLELTQAQIDALVQLEGDIAVLDRQREKAEELRDLYDDIGDSIGSAFEDVVFGASSAEDAIESMVKNITRLIFDMLVTQQIAGFISGALAGAFGGGGGGGNITGGFSGGGTGAGPGNARGGVHGSLSMMSAGGLIGPSPTRMSNGSMNFLTNEAGPEAVVPLARDSRGRLGIRDSGGGGGRSITVNMNVQARDAASFGDRKSQAQIQRRLRQTVSHATSQMPGG